MTWISKLGIYYYLFTYFGDISGTKGAILSFLGREASQTVKRRRMWKSSIFVNNAILLLNAGKDLGIWEWESERGWEATTLLVGGPTCIEEQGSKTDHNRPSSSIPSGEKRALDNERSYEEAICRCGENASTRACLLTAFALILHEISFLAVVLEMASSHEKTVEWRRVIESVG